MKNTINSLEFFPNRYYTTSKNMDFTELESHIENTVSEKRMRHCKATASVAVGLAGRFKRYHITEEDARIVGLWHDIAREWGDEALYHFCVEHDITMEVEEQECPMLLHGAVASVLLRQRCADVPQYYIDAIRWHTLGSTSMGPLGAMLFIADYLEPYRTHIDDPNKVRILSLSSLEQMCLDIISMTEDYFARRKACPLATSTLNLKQYLKVGGTF
ncbi:MAG: bis(5'-nucleosyl)-tetraphosphatase (symmetrical) YqeK [Sphaerochaetaceae bacterium]